MIKLEQTIQSRAEYERIFNEAEKYRSEGRIPKAVEAYKSLLYYWCELKKKDPNVPFTINEFFIVDRLADFSVLTGNKLAAKHLLTGMSQIAKIAGNIGIRIHAVTKLLFVNLNNSLLDTAFENARSLSDIIGNIESIEISASGLIVWENNVSFYGRCKQQDEADYFVCIYDALGGLLLAFGRFSEAVMMYQRGIQIGEKNISPIVSSRLLSMKVSRATALFEKGEIELAKTSVNDVEPEADLAETITGLQIRLLDLKSKIALAQGEMGEGYRLINYIINSCRQLQLPLAEVHACFNLAQTQILLNQVNEAATILNDCLIKSRRMGEEALVSKIERFLQVTDNRVQATFPPLNYAKTRELNVISSKRKVDLEQKSFSYRRSEDFLNFFQEKALIYQMHFAKSEEGKATEILSELRLLVQKCDSILIHTRFKVLEFLLLYFTSSTIPSQWSYQSLITYLEKNHLLPELWQLRQFIGHTNLLSENEKAKWKVENQRILDQITNSLPPTMQTLFLLNKWSSNEEYLSGFSNELVQLKQKISTIKCAPLRWLKQWKLMKSIHLFQEDVTRYKDHLSRSISNGEKITDFSFLISKKGAFRKIYKQPKNTLSVTYLVLPDRIIIISRSFLKIRVHITYISRVLLRQFVFALRDSLYPQGKFKEIGSIKPISPLTASEPLLGHLGKVLQLETIIKEHNESIEHISFIADDVLHGLPFTLLPFNGKTLLETKRINISINDAPPERKTISFLDKNILLAGVSDAVAGLRELPGVRSEITEINDKLKHVCKQVKIFLNEKARVQEIKNELLSTDFAHFSCHGKFDFQRPDQSGLALAGGDMLTLKDILAIGDLSRIKLVVLSSCRGAEHYIMPGRWIIGLPETLCRAGVRAVLAFLWPVDDLFATEFTSRYYDYLKDYSPAESFRLTVIDAKNKRFSNLTSEYWHPKFWAGAVFYEG